MYNRFFFSSTESVVFQDLHRKRILGPVNENTQSTNIFLNFNVTTAIAEIPSTVKSGNVRA